MTRISGGVALLETVVTTFRLGWQNRLFPEDPFLMRCKKMGIGLGDSGLFTKNFRSPSFGSAI